MTNHSPLGYLCPSPVLADCSLLHHTGSGVPVLGEEFPVQVVPVPGEPANAGHLDEVLGQSGADRTPSEVPLVAGPAEEGLQAGGDQLTTGVTEGLGRHGRRCG